MWAAPGWVEIPGKKETMRHFFTKFVVNFISETIATCLFVAYLRCNYFFLFALSCNYFLFTLSFLIARERRLCDICLRFCSNFGFVFSSILHTLVSTRNISKSLGACYATNFFNLALFSFSFFTLSHGRLFGVMCRCSAR